MKPKRIDLLNPPPPRTESAILSKGFRPFFLLAALFAVAMLPLWLLVYLGPMTAPDYLPPAAWHAHEMLFGFTVAVIAGFLLTAASNWTRLSTAEGRWLSALCLLWILGRVGMWTTGWLPQVAVAAVDLAFLPAVAFAVGRPIVAARTGRNYGLVVVLLVLALANFAVHLDALGVAEGWAARGNQAGVDLIMIVIAVIAGRIVPVFTVNATEAAILRATPWLDRIVVAALVLMTGVDLAAPGHWLAAIFATIAALAAARRAWGWNARYTLDQPLLWVLHAGHAWLVIGLLLRGVHAAWPFFPAVLATHALTIGAIGVLTLGMMVRVGLGHTDRALEISRWETAAFAAMNLAAVVRTFAPMVSMDLYRASLLASGALWTLAFAVYLVRFAPILWAPNVDWRERR